MPNLGQVQAPTGATELSLALQRWGAGRNDSSPVGMTEFLPVDVLIVPEPKVPRLKPGT
jgi:hypothetical protein